MKRQAGFTLTEMLVVIVICIILLGLSAATLAPMRKMYQVIDSPAYRGAKQVETTLREARRLAMQTGVPHSVAFNRRAPVCDGSDNFEGFRSNFGVDTAPPHGDNYMVIVRHQRKSGGAFGDTPVIDPWSDWTTTTDSGAAFMNRYAVTTENAGRLPSGAGFMGLGAGIPDKAHTDYRVWRWCWDHNAYGTDSDGRPRKDEYVRVWVGAAGATSVKDSNGENSDGQLLYASSFVKTKFPYTLGARVTFLPSGEMIAYVGGRPAVYPDGPYTPPYNHTLTPNGYHVVAVGDTGDASGPANDNTATAVTLKTISNSNHANEEYYTYFIGIHQLTGETFVKNRFEMLSWANNEFPCPTQSCGASDYAAMDNKRIACIKDCAASGSGKYLTAAKAFVTTAAAGAAIPTPASVGDSNLSCCQEHGACQWRAAIRLE